MKKILSGGKLWTILSALIFFMTCGVFVLGEYGGGRLLDPIIDLITGNRNFNNYNVENLEENKLTADSRNKLMNDLQEWSVPEGTIASFENQCPDNWNIYTPAPNNNMGNGVITKNCIKGEGTATSIEPGATCKGYVPGYATARGPQGNGTRTELDNTSQIDANGSLKACVYAEAQRCCGNKFVLCYDKTQGKKINSKICQDAFGQIPSYAANCVDPNLDPGGPGFSSDYITEYRKCPDATL